jgi:hypothetical protein
MAAARLIVLDDGLPPSLAAELRARGRPATTVAELGLRAAPDADVLAQVAERHGVLVVLREPASAQVAAPVAVVVARSDAGRRDVVHRHAGAIAAQRRGRRAYG